MKRKNRKNHKKIEYMIYKGDFGKISKELIKNDIQLYVVEFFRGSWTCFETKENFIKKAQGSE